MIPLLTSVFGCGAAAGHPEERTEDTMAPADASLPITWELSRDGEILVIDYQIRNLTAADVWLLDVAHVPVVAGYEPQPARITVLPGNDTVRLLRGHLRPPPGQGVAVEYTPVARRLVAGEGLTGQAKVALPVQPWHPYYVLKPSSSTQKQANLELGVLIGDPPEGVPHWDPRFSKDTTGATIHVPTLGFVVQRQKLVGASPLPLP